MANLTNLINDTGQLSMFNSELEELINSGSVVQAILAATYYTIANEEFSQELIVPVLDQIKQHEGLVSSIVNEYGVPITVTADYFVDPNPTWTARIRFYGNGDDATPSVDKILFRAELVDDLSNSYYLTTDFTSIDEVISIGTVMPEEGRRTSLSEIATKFLSGTAVYQAMSSSIKYYLSGGRTIEGLLSAIPQSIQQGASDVCVAIDTLVRVFSSNPTPAALAATFQQLLRRVGSIVSGSANTFKWSVEDYVTSDTVWFALPALITSAVSIASAVLSRFSVVFQPISVAAGAIGYLAYSAVEENERSTPALISNAIINGYGAWAGRNYVKGSQLPFTPGLSGVSMAVSQLGSGLIYDAPIKGSDNFDYYPVEEFSACWMPKTTEAWRRLAEVFVTYSIIPDVTVHQTGSVSTPELRLVANVRYKGVLNSNVLDKVDNYWTAGSRLASFLEWKNQHPEQFHTPTPDDSPSVLFWCAYCPVMLGRYAAGCSIITDESELGSAVDIDRNTIQIGSWSDLFSLSPSPYRYSLHLGYDCSSNIPVGTLNLLATDAADNFSIMYGLSLRNSPQTPVQGFSATSYMEQLTRINESTISGFITEYVTQPSDDSLIGVMSSLSFTSLTNALVRVWSAVRGMYGSAGVLSWISENAFGSVPLDVCKVPIPFGAVLNPLIVPPKYKLSVLTRGVITSAAIVATAVGAVITSSVLTSTVTRLGVTHLRKVQDARAAWEKTGSKKDWAKYWRTKQWYNVCSNIYGTGKYDVYRNALEIQSSTTDNEAMNRGLLGVFAPDDEIIDQTSESAPVSGNSTAQIAKLIAG